MIIKQKGIIQFELKDVTNKHKLQSSWKRTAMVKIDGDITHYYAWFLEKRYGLILNKPLRGAHITFINDRASDMNDKWDEVKTKWNGKEIEISLSVDIRTSGEHWWLNIPEEDRTELHNIRAELGLGRPHWGLHLSIGYAAHLQLEQSKYIHNLIINKLANE